MASSLRAVTLLFVLAAADAAQTSSDAFGTRLTKGQTKSHDLEHITGMVASRVHKDILWMISSRDSVNRLFAVNADTGAEVASFIVSGTHGYDWEDLTYGPCVDDCGNAACGVGKPVSRYCIYIADIGAHGGDGAHDKVYMVREPLSLPSLQPGAGVYQGNVSVADYMTFSWSEEDAESLMIAPDGRMFVLSKVDTGRAMLAQLPFNAWGGNTVVINEANTGILKIHTSHHDPQGAAISPGGDEMIIVGEDDVWYYKFQDGDYINAIRTQIPGRVTKYVSVPDTEAITWDAEANGFYTYAMGKNQYIYYYPRDSNAGIIG